MHPATPPSFTDADVPLQLLRARAFNLRWATLPPDVIPLTAADPDFAVAPAITAAMIDYIQGGVFSYGPAEGLPSFRAACAQMRTTRKGHSCDPAQILAVDSAAAGMLHVARLALKPGDEAIVFDPVDFLFKSSVEAAGGQVRLLPIEPTTGMIDFSALEALVSARTRLLCVCNPHNPLGRVLTADELRRLGDFAVAHDLLILNDEIWSDIVFDGRPFISLPTLSPAIAARTFTVQGLSKTFGLAGLRVGFVVAPTPALFDALLAVSMAQSTMTGVATLSQVGATAAYTHAWPWADAFVQHMQRMRDLALGVLAAVPGLQVRAPEGTYVLFPDVRAWDVEAEALTARLLHHHRVAVVPGATRWFGPGAEGHLRICFATAEGVLRTGLTRLCEGLHAARLADTGRPRPSAG